MANIYSFVESQEASQRPYKENIEVTSVVVLDSIDSDSANRITVQLLACADSLKSKGSLRIDTEFDPALNRLQITFFGSLAAVMRILNCKDVADNRVLEDDVAVSGRVQIDPIDGHFSTSLSSHLLISAKNHPQNDMPLRIDSEYDESGRRLKLVFNGSNFAVTYLYAIVYLRFTQRLDRQARSA
jgi:hypothetical protein